jgi:hypothetical protein
MSNFSVTRPTRANVSNAIDKAPAGEAGQLNPVGNKDANPANDGRNLVRVQVDALSKDSFTSAPTPAQSK